MVTGGPVAVVLSLLLGAGAAGHGVQLLARRASWAQRSTAVAEVVMALTMLATVWGWAVAPSAGLQLLVFGLAAAWFGYRWLHRLGTSRLLGMAVAGDDHCGHHAVAMGAMAVMAVHVLLAGHQANRHGGDLAGWGIVQPVVLVVLVLAAVRCVALVVAGRRAGGRREPALMLAMTAGMACAFLPA